MANNQATSSQFKFSIEPTIKLNVEYIRRANHGATRMIDDLRDASLTEVGSFALICNELDLASMIWAAIDHLPELAGRCQLQVESGIDARAWGDSDRVEHVLVSILATVAKVGRPLSAIKIQLSRLDRALVVSVESQGCNIDAASLVRIFECLDRSSWVECPRIAGAKLSLYVAKGIIEAHGGSLWTDSTPGVVTRFHFTLPIPSATRLPKSRSSDGPQLTA